jgi:hypothetical protein
MSPNHLLYSPTILLALSLRIEVTGHILVLVQMVLLRLPSSALEVSERLEHTSGALLLLTELTQNQGKLLPSTSIIIFNIYNVGTG